MFSQAKKGKKDPVGSLTPSAVVGWSRVVCSFQKHPSSFYTGQNIQIKRGVDRPTVRVCHASPSFLPSFFGPFQLFLGPRKGYLSGAQWKEELLPAPLTRPGMNDSQWAPLWPGKGDRPHRTSSTTTTPHKTFEVGGGGGGRESIIVNSRESK